MHKIIFIFICLASCSMAMAETSVQALKQCAGVETPACHKVLAQAQNDCSQLIQEDRQAAQHSEFCKTLLTLEWGEGW